MADRYWVGGTGSWSSTNTANWSTSPGGAGGASVPTAADNVFFDAGSDSGGTFVVTMANTPRVCNDITIGSLDFGMTLAGTSIGLTVSGSLSFPATNLTRTYTGTTTFNATTTGKTVTTNGVAFGAAVTFNGVGGGWTLGSAFSCGSSTLTLTNGTLDTSSSGNYSITAGTFSSSNSNTRTINLNASTVTVTTGWTMTTATNATFNAGTSQINLSSLTTSFSGGGLTYYNVSFTSSTAVTSTKPITGANTFNNLTFTAPASAGVNRISFSANQTINGTLTITGAASTRRIFIFSNLVTLSRTLTCAAISTTSDTDFRNIIIAGAHGTLSGTRLGNCGANSNITFDAGVNKYWNLAAGGNWSSTAWALSSGGAVDVNNFPLAQDSVVIENTGLNTSATVTINANWNIGNLDTSTRTNAMTLATGATNPVFCGDFVYGSGVTPSGTGDIYFTNYAIKTLNSGGKTFTQSMYVQCLSVGGVQLVTNNLTIASTRFIFLNSGTLDLNNLILTAGLMYQSGSSISIAFGTTGSVLLNQSSSGQYVFYNDTFVSYTGTHSITVAPTAATAVLFYAVNAYNQPFIFSGTAPIQLSGQYLGGIDFTGYTGTITRASTIYFSQDVTLSSGMTIATENFTIYFYAYEGTTKKITSNGKAFPIHVEFNGNSGTWQLQDAMTVTTPYPSVVTASTVLTSSGLDLNGFTLTTHSFSLSNISGTARSIAFGTGNITCTQPNSGWSIFVMYYGAGFSFTGTPTVNLSSTMASGSTTAFSGANTYSSFASIALNFNVTSGSYLLYFQYSGAFGTTGYIGGVDCTGFSGTFRLSGYAGIQGNMKFSPAMTLATQSSSYYYFMYPPTGTTIDITTSGKTIPNFFYFSGVSSTSTCRLLDAFTSSTNLQLYGAALDLNGQTLTALRIDLVANPFILTFNAGNVVVTGIIFNNGITTNLTTIEGTGAGTISMTSSVGKTFGGGGATYNCTLNQGGAGALTVSGSNTLKDITNSVQPATVTFTSGTTQTFTDNFSLSGTAGNLVTIQSSTTSGHTLSKASGVISVSYCTISRSNATGGASWYAFTSNGNVDGGNNSGWNFSGVYYGGGNFFSFF